MTMGCRMPKGDLGDELGRGDAILEGEAGPEGEGSRPKSSG